MTLQYRTAWIAAACAVCAGPSLAAASGLRCPDAIEPRAELAAPVDGWRVEVDPGRPGHRLDGIGFFLGPPRDGGRLAPDAERKGKDTLTATWNLPASGAEEFWIACSYADTNLMLVRKLDRTVRSCAVEHQLSAKGAVVRVKGVACRQA